MHISSQTLRLALLRIFADAGLRAGDWLAFPEVACAWSATGLRDSDLRVAVHEMLDSGDLISLERDSALGLALSTSQYQRLYRQDGELQLATAEERSNLASVRYRPHRGADAGLRRRSEDFLE
ncbi:MAG: hypothetical protein OSA97_19690 [Nevskia sp.]|nr:hypothetical protein [Nevskia sp.]